MLLGLGILSFRVYPEIKTELLAEFFLTIRHLYTRHGRTKWREARPLSSAFPLLSHGAYAELLPNLKRFLHHEDACGHRERDSKYDSKIL